MRVAAGILLLLLSACCAPQVIKDEPFGAYCFYYMIGTELYHSCSAAELRCLERQKRAYELEYYVTESCKDLTTQLETSYTEDKGYSDEVSSGH